MHTFQWLLNVHAVLKDLQTFLIRFHRISLDLLRDLSCGCQMSNQCKWARFVNFVDLSSLPALDIWIFWTWRRKSDPNNVKDKQIFEVIRKVGMIKRILCLQPSERSNYLPPTPTTRCPPPPSSPPLQSSSPPSTSLSDLKFGRKCGGPGKGNGRPWNWKKDVANYKQLLWSRSKKVIYVKYHVL